MFESDVAEWGTAETLAASARAQADEHEAGVQRLLLDVHFADLHPDPAMIQADQSCPGGERGLHPGGPGCPGVAEFAVAEFGVVMGVSTMTAAKNIGQALALRHRLPLIWDRVLAREAIPWRAREVATASMTLSVEAAAIVDRRVAPIINTVGPIQLRNIVKAALWEADPEAARAAAEEKARERGVYVGRSDDHGTSTIVVKADTGSVIFFDATIDQIADALTTLEGPAPRQEQRARAFSIMADPALSHLFLQVAQYLATHQPTTTNPAGTPATDPTPDATANPTPETSSTPDSPDSPDTADNSADPADPAAVPTGNPANTSNTTNPAHTPKAPDAPEVPDATAVPDAQEVPEVPEVPEVSDAAADGVDTAELAEAPDSLADSAPATDSALEDTPPAADPSASPHTPHAPSTPHPASTPSASNTHGTTDGANAGEPIGHLPLAEEPDWLDEPDPSTEPDWDRPRPNTPGHPPAPPDPLDPPPRTRVEPLDPAVADNLVTAMDTAARHNLATKLFALKTAADKTSTSGGRSRPAHTKLYIHLTDETLLAGQGTMRIEGHGPVYAKLAELIGYDRVVIQPVIDLNENYNVNAYEIPSWMRERIKLTYPVEQFPYGPGETTNRTDLDHVVPYDPNGPQGQTSTANLRPLSRRSHRIKTLAGWTEHTNGNATEWTTPHGYRFRVDHNGTHPIHDGHT